MNVERRATAETRVVSEIQETFKERRVDTLPTEMQLVEKKIVEEPVQELKEQEINAELSEQTALTAEQKLGKIKGMIDDYKTKRAQRQELVNPTSNKTA